MEQETRRSHRDTKKPFWKNWKFWALFVVVAFLVTGISKCVGEFKKESTSPSTKIYKLNSDKSVRTMLKHYEPNLKVTKVSGVYDDPTSKTVLVTVKEDSGWNNKSAVKLMHEDIAEIWKSFKKSKGNNFENIAIMVTAPYDDAGGNTHQTKAMTSDLDGSKLNDLNLDGFSDDNVPIFATKYWQRNDLPNISK